MNDEGEVSESEKGSLNLESPWQPTYFDIARFNSDSEERSPLMISRVLTREDDDDDDCSIFPPIDHEGLFVPSQHNPLQTPHHQHASSPPPPPPLNPPNPTDPAIASRPPLKYRIRLARDGFRWMWLWIALLRAKFFGVASSIRDYAVVGGGIWPFVSGAGAATAGLFWFLYARARRRRQRQRVRESSVDHLIAIIKEKDEKIIQLLHQIAQMNEVLLAFRGVTHGGSAR